MKHNKVITFTPEVITKNNFGLILVVDKPSTRIINNADYICTVVYKLVYKHITGVTKYGLCNILTDGWIYWIGNNYQETCDYLNNNKYDIKYRILTQEEFIYLITNNTNINQLVQIN